MCVVVFFSQYTERAGRSILLHFKNCKKKYVHALMNTVSAHFVPIRQLSSEAQGWVFSWEFISLAALFLGYFRNKTLLCLSTHLVQAGNSFLNVHIFFLMKNSWLAIVLWTVVS